MPVTSAWTDPNSLDLLTNQVLTQTVWEQLLGDVLWLNGTAGTWTAFTPTLTQNVGIAITVNNARYIKIGHTVIVYILVTTSATGTAGNDIIIGGIPAAIAPLSSGAATCVGSFQYRGATF